MSSALPFTVQDDIKQKEKYASQQQQRSGRYCSSRRIRLWTLIGIVSLCTLGLVNYFGKAANSVGGILGDEMQILTQPLEEKVIQKEPEKKETPQTLKEEITQLISSNKLIVFSKTYCPFSRNAKSILATYDLKDPLEVVEVDLRDDDYAVKMTLKEISGRETFPNIFLNGKTLGGSDDLEELHSSGKLETLLIRNQLLLKKSN